MSEEGMGMVDRVARAIYEEDDPWHKAWPWPDLNESQGSADAYRRIAIAAIKAMHDPTPDMVDAGRDVGPAAPYGIFEVREHWQAMINKALEG